MVIPRTFIGKHLRFSDQDAATIIAAGAKQPAIHQRPGRPILGPASPLDRIQIDWRKRLSFAA